MEKKYKEKEKSEYPIPDTGNMEFETEYFVYRKQIKCRTCPKNRDCYGTRYCQQVFKAIAF